MVMGAGWREGGSGGAEIGTTIIASTTTTTIINKIGLFEEGLFFSFVSIYFGY